MGAKPVTCLNLIGFPSGQLGPEVLHGIVEGALSKITEAGAVLAGGHTTDDEEPKFGLSVTGTVHPDRYWRNAGAQEGDVLILTKPIGSGVLFNANLKNWVSDDAMKACVDTITRLNQTAAEIASGFDIHAATDITGFGLAGHALEMAQGSGVSIHIHTSEVPTMAEALDMYKKGITTGVNSTNKQLIEHATRFEADLPDWHREIFVDPQTSGGLLLALSEDKAPGLLSALQDGGIAEARIVANAAPRGDSDLVFI